MAEPSTFNLQPLTERPPTAFSAQSARVALRPEDVEALARTLGVSLLPGEAEIVAPDLATGLALWRRLRSRFGPGDEPILIPEPR